MTVQRLIELLEEIENKDLLVMLDVTGPDADQFHMMEAASAEEITTANGAKLCMITKGDTRLFDADGERLN